MDFNETKKNLESADSVFHNNSGGREWAYYGLKRNINKQRDPEEVK